MRSNLFHRRLHPDGVDRPAWRQARWTGTCCACVRTTVPCASAAVKALEPAQAAGPVALPCAGRQPVPVVPVAVPGGLWTCCMHRWIRAGTQRCAGRSLPAGRRTPGSRSTFRICFTATTESNVERRACELLTRELIAARSIANGLLQPHSVRLCALLRHGNGRSNGHDGIRRATHLHPTCGCRRRGVFPSACNHPP